MYRVQYRTKGTKKEVWRNFRYNGKVKYFYDIYDARYMMRRMYNAGYDAQIFDCTNKKWIERMER